MSEALENELSQISTGDLLSHIDEMLLPITVKENLRKSIKCLVTALEDVTANSAYLEAKLQQMKNEANSLSLVVKAASETKTKEFVQDEFLINRAVNHFGSKLLREQINRENTVKKAVEDLKSDPPKEDIKKEIDLDWLEMFSRIAETKSNEDVQIFLSKILAGEIRNPGTFGPRTIQTLSLLDQRTAQLFQSFCNVAFELPQLNDALTCVISEPFGSPGNNGLKSIGLDYLNLTQLQDTGLIQHDLNAWREMPVQLFVMPFKIGNKIFSFQITNETPKDAARISIINFTKVGLELRKVLHVSDNPTYNEKFSSG